MPNLLFWWRFHSGCLLEMINVWDGWYELYLWYCIISTSVGSNSQNTTSYCAFMNSKAWVMINFREAVLVSKIVALFLGSGTHIYKPATIRGPSCNVSSVFDSLFKDNTYLWGCQVKFLWCTMSNTLWCIVMLLCWLLYINISGVYFCCNVNILFH